MRSAICVKTDKLGGLKRIEYQTVTVLKMYCASKINIKMFGKQFVQYKESAIEYYNATPLYLESTNYLSILEYLYHM